MAGRYLKVKMWELTTLSDNRPTTGANRRYTPATIMNMRPVWSWFNPNCEQKSNRVITVGPCCFTYSSNYTWSAKNGANVGPRNVRDIYKDNHVAKYCGRIM